MGPQIFRVGKIWHYRFTVDNRRVQRTTGETAKAKAVVIAEQAFRQAVLWSHGEKAIPNVAELVRQWLHNFEGTASRSHLRIVEIFGRLHLYDLADTPIDQLSTDLVEDARRQHLIQHAPASVNQWIRVLKLLCNWAVRRRVIPALPFNIRLHKVQKRPRVMLSVSLGDKWLTAIDAGQKGRVGISNAVRLMLGLGLRESETLSARWEWIDWDRQTYTPGVTKGREADPLPIPDWLFNYLLPQRVVTGLIVTKPDGRGFAPGFTRNAMLAASKSVGAGHITAHRLRGTFATMLSESGTPIQAVQRALRHKSPMTTMGYLETDLGQVVIGQRRIASRFGFDVGVNLTGEAVANDNQQSHT